jgi:hypothetical protein
MHNHKKQTNKQTTTTVIYNVWSCVFQTTRCVSLCLYLSFAAIYSLCRQETKAEKSKSLISKTERNKRITGLT